MKSLPRISDTEWIVMRVLWSSSPLTAGQVVKALSQGTPWMPRTIKTFLGRLVRKGAIGFTTEGRTYSYFPLVAEADCVRSENDSFLNRVHGGALSSLLSSFLDARKLTTREIEELKRILDKKKE
jgi:BlaI family penicillinase repressor